MNMAMRSQLTRAEVARPVRGRLGDSHGEGSLDEDHCQKRGRPE